MVGGLLVSGTLTPISARRADDLSAVVSRVVVPLDEQAGRDMHGREGKTSGRDVRSPPGECRIRRVDSDGRGNVRDPLVAHLARDAEAAMLAGVANHSAPVVSGLGNRGRVDEPVPARAVIAHELRSAAGRRRVPYLAPDHRIVLAGWAADEEGPVQQDEAATGS